MSSVGQERELRRQQEVDALLHVYGRQGRWRLVLACASFLLLGAFVLPIWGNFRAMGWMFGHVLCGFALVCCLPYAILIRLRLMKAAGDVPCMLAMPEPEREFYRGALLSMNDDLRLFSKCMKGLALGAIFFLVMVFVMATSWSG